jgi:hypothetical protein
MGVVYSLIVRDAMGHLPGEILRSVTRFRLELDRRFGARLRAVTLFGSRARGDAEPESLLLGCPVLRSCAGDEVRNTSIGMSAETCQDVDGTCRDVAGTSCSIRLTGTSSEIRKRDTERSSPMMTSVRPIPAATGDGTAR